MTEFAPALEYVSKFENSPDLTERRMFRHIMRVVRVHVNSTELEIVLFIFDRTYTYGKTAEAISYKHFLEGVWYQGQLLHPPVSVKLAMLKRILQNLSDNDIIQRRTDRRTHRTYYMINPLWIGNVTERNVTERKLNTRSVATTVAKHGYPSSQGVATPVPPIEQEDKSNMKITKGAAVPRTSTSDLDNALAKYNVSRTKSKTKGGATAYMRTWEDAFRDTYPDEQFFSWTGKELRNFKLALDRGVLPADRTTFIQYVVTEFPKVLQRQLKWMRDKPEFPTVVFVTQWTEQFWRDYIDRSNPNRKLKAAIARAEKPQVSETPGAPEIKKLERKLAETQELARTLLKERGDAQDEDRARRRSKAKKLVLKRRTSSEEFGSWD